MLTKYTYLHFYNKCKNFRVIEYYLLERELIDAEFKPIINLEKYRIKQKDVRTNYKKLFINKCFTSEICCKVNCFIFFSKNEKNK